MLYAILGFMVGFVIGGMKLKRRNTRVDITHFNAEPKWDGYWTYVKEFAMDVQTGWVRFQSGDQECLRRGVTLCERFHQNERTEPLPVRDYTKLWFFLDGELYQTFYVDTQGPDRRCYFTTSDDPAATLGLVSFTDLSTNARVTILGNLLDLQTDQLHAHRAFELN